MADGGGNGRVWRRPEPLSHRQWTGGVEGGAVEERVWHSGVDKGGRGEKVERRRPTPFMVAQWRGQRGKRAGGLPGFGTTWMEKWGREGGGVWRRIAQRPALAPGRRAWAAGLSHNRGGWRGVMTQRMRS
jgi:hypothetical protein